MRQTHSRHGWAYRSALGYRISMGLRYGLAYRRRDETVASLIPDGSSVADLCCGPAFLAHRLRTKRCRYSGFDVNETFVQEACGRGVNARLWDGFRDPIPEAEVLCLLSSLYHFGPDAPALLRRLHRVAKRRLILAEPVRNLAQSSIPPLRWISRELTRVHGEAFDFRFSRESLVAAFEEAGLSPSKVLECGPEVICVFEGAP